MSASEDLPTREFEPLPKQKQFLHSMAGQVLLSGSFGAGKSRIGCEKGYLLNQMYPGNRGLIVRKHFSDVRASTIQQTLLEEVIPESHIPEDGHNKGNHEIQHRTGVTDDDGEPILSQIHYHGLDSGKSTSDDDLPRKIGSHAYGWIFVDEGTELSRGEWSQLQGRLRYKGKRQLGKFYEVPFRQIFTATNPASPQHWMYKMFFEEGKGEVVKMNVEDNPHVPEEYIERMRRNLSGMYYERYFKGKWIGAEGVIYSEYDPDVHIVQPEDLPMGWNIVKEREYDEERSVWADPPPDWRVYRTIDLGYRNPFVCFDDETEILTEDGWVDLPDLPRDVDVATVDMDTEELEYQRPLSYIEQEYDGEMITAESGQAGANFSVTPNHQMVIKNRRNDRDQSWKKVRADNLPEWDHAIPVGGWTRNGESDADQPFRVPNAGGDKTLETTRGAFAFFLGFWLADGDAKASTKSGYHVRLCQKESEPVEKVLDEVGWNYSVHENSSGISTFDIASKDLYQFLDDHDLLGLSHEKRLPEFVFEWSVESLQRLLDGLMLGDGASPEVGGEKLHTTSQSLADGVQRLATELGMASNIYTEDGGDYDGSRDTVYTVKFSVHQQATIQKLDMERREYDGKVYCCEVPNGTLVVRRNGRPMVCGNCQWWAQSPDNQLIMFRELYETELLVEDAAERINEQTSDEWLLENTYTDHDAEGVETLRKAGVYAANAKKDVSPGIQAVKSRLRTDERGEPGLQIMAHARTHPPDARLKLDDKPVRTTDEIPGYVWKDDDQQDEPKKENDHGVDAMRYLVFTVDEGATMSREEMEKWSEIMNSGTF